VQVALAVQQAHPLTLVTAADPVIISADAGRLRQVIDNLLNNALQHTPAPRSPSRSRLFPVMPSSP